MSEKDDGGPDILERIKYRLHIDPRSTYVSVPKTAMRELIAEIERLRSLTTWRPIQSLSELGENDRHFAYLALDNGEVVFAEWCAGHTTSAEYHGTTGVYLGQSMQDAWAYYMGDSGDQFERHDDGSWTTTRHVLKDGAATEETYPVKVVGWADAMRPKPEFRPALKAGGGGS